MKIFGLDERKNRPIPHRFFDFSQCGVAKTRQSGVFFDLHTSYDRVCSLTYRWHGTRSNEEPWRSALTPTAPVP